VSPKSDGTKKIRVYEIAKDMKMSSEAVVDLIRGLGFEVKSHMSTVEPDIIAKIHSKMDAAKEQVKAEVARKREHETEVARRVQVERQQREAAAQAASRPAAGPSAPAAPRPAAPPAPGSSPYANRPGGTTGASRPQGGGGGGYGGGTSVGGPPRYSGPGGGGGGPSRFGGGPGGPGRRRVDKKKKRPVDDKLVTDSVKKTLASMEAGSGRRRRRSRGRDEDGGGEVATEDLKVLRVTEFITVGELANVMEVKPQEVLQACLDLGIMASINRRLDKDAIEMVADEFGFAAELVTEQQEAEEDNDVDDPARMVSRPPVVTVMGHVDHGKTSLLDYIRKSQVVAGEAGGITQHIGAYEVEIGGKAITFLDTPGHEAFTAMRARGAQATDIVVLVVAADDRVMPQTREAIDHARAANVPIVVAINKMDLPDANVDLVKQDLSRAGVAVEEYGGKTAAVPISAKKGTNIDKLLEYILLEAELLELKADPTRRARGVVLEARIEQGRGIVATVLVEQGTLGVGDAFVAGVQSGKVRAMTNERGKPVKDAGPSTPVEVIGWSGAPQAGDRFSVYADEREAREVAGKRQLVAREQDNRQTRRVTLEQLHEQMVQGAVSELNLVLKGDVDGSVEALAESFSRLGSSEVKIRVIRQGVGQISESDVLLAAASNAVIVGFHVRPDPKARELANQEKVDIRLYQVIYEAVEDLKKALSGLLKPEIKETVTGAAEVRNVFNLSKAGTIAGCYVRAGTILRSSKVRLIRNNDVIWDGRIASLKRFKDDVREVSEGFECGIGLEGYDTLQVGDLIEAYKLEELARTLD
jgi:translation initiation factor IF-2